jgi:hypothetical protein
MHLTVAEEGYGDMEGTKQRSWVKRWSKLSKKPTNPPFWAFQPVLNDAELIAGEAARLASPSAVRGLPPPG